jgi:hypothetical protein
VHDARGGPNFGVSEGLDVLAEKVDESPFPLEDREQAEGRIVSRWLRRLDHCGRGCRRARWLSGGESGGATGECTVDEYSEETDERQPDPVSERELCVGHAAESSGFLGR